jgi:hypothetical protein
MSFAWPPTFDRNRKLRLLAEERATMRQVEWNREDEGEGNILWWATTPYSETLFISRDANHTFHASYQVNGTWDNPVLDEVELGEHPSFIKAKLAVTEHAVEIWAGYRAWEERMEQEWAEDQAREDARDE